jgi:putative intracellular protease/amidase
MQKIPKKRTVMRTTGRKQSQTYRSRPKRKEGRAHCQCEFSSANKYGVLSEKLADLKWSAYLGVLGGDYSKADDWEPCVVVDGNLITGQNPASSKGAASALLDQLNADVSGLAVPELPGSEAVG